MAGKIDRKHNRFIEKYIQYRFNGTKAYMDVYKCSYDTARNNASRLLATASIRQEIDKRLRAEHLSTDEALQILKEHAQGSLSDFLDEDGTIDLAAAKENGLLHLLKEVEVQETDGEKSSSKRVKVKLHDPQNAIDKILRVQGAYKDNLNLNVRKVIKVTIGKADAE